MERNLGQLASSSEKNQFSEQKERAELISRYIETRVIGKNESLTLEEEKELQEYYTSISPREKADLLYSKMMAYMVDRQAEETRKKEAEEKGEKYENEKPDPYFISEVKVLFNDSSVKNIIPQTYGEARIDRKKIRASELGNLWNNTIKEIQLKENQYKQLEQDLYLNKIKGEKKISDANSHITKLAKNIFDLERRQRELETLQGFSETPENTDVVAHFQYENLKEYRRQLDKGFVWLPSRKEIHRKTVNAILNHRWPVLIGESGSGKSQQANAAAIELTGHYPTEIECESTTSETHLIGDIAIDPKTGGSYEKYGPLKQAFTGYEDSLQKEPTYESGRICRFDESGRLGEKAYSIIKKARQKKIGDDFYGRPVLPGAGAIWTTNPVGPRYPDRKLPDSGLRRELAEIYVGYPEMSAKNPELYEFALAALQDKNYHVLVAKEELAPCYEKKDIPENQRKVLEDGSIVIAKDEIVENLADQRHGALWRFCAGIKSVQDSFIYGNAETEKYPDTHPRFKEDDEGKIEITTDGTGEPLTLSTSTITLGELASWMKGFNERRQKRDDKFHVETLTEWFNFKIKTYLDQADKADKEKLRALFDHFGFLENAVVPNLANTNPLIPKDIGYLSPRVPRPVYVEKPVTAKDLNNEGLKQETKKEIKEYETSQVLLEDGSRILMKAQEFILENGAFDVVAKKIIPLEVIIGKRFIVNGKTYSFAGVVKDSNSPHNNHPIGQSINEANLYKIFSPEELNWGIEEDFKKLIGETGVSDMEEDIQDYWKTKKT